MEKIETYIKNKKERVVLERFSKLSNYSTSTLKLSLAIALFLMAALFISGAGVIVENGALNVSNNLLVNTNTLYADANNNRVGINTTTPASILTVNGNFSVGNSNADYISVNPNGNIVIRAGSGNSASSINFYDDLGTNVLTVNRNNGFLMKTHLQFTMGGIYDIGTSVANNDPRYIYVRNGMTIGNINHILNGSLAFFNTNVGIATTSPNQKLMVSGNANVTGTIYYGALQANSPVLERTAELFVARCTIADDGKLVVEYIHGESGAYSKVIEAVNPDSTSWWHKSCFEKNEKFKYLDSLNNNSITIDDIGFDWAMKKAFVKA